MVGPIKRVIRITLGVFFFLLGLAGLVLPILQGWLFLGLAVVLLSRDIPFLAGLEARMMLRFPKVGHVFERVRKAIPLWDD